MTTKAGRAISRDDGAGCAVDPFLKLLAREWTSHIVWTLEACGLVSRHDVGKLPRHVEYRPTYDGRRLDAELRRREYLAGRLKMRAGFKPKS